METGLICITRSVLWGSLSPGHDREESHAVKGSRKDPRSKAPTLSNKHPRKCRVRPPAPGDSRMAVVPAGALLKEACHRGWALGSQCALCLLLLGRQVSLSVPAAMPLPSLTLTF